MTYSVPVKAKLKLYCTDPEHEDFDTVVQDVYLGTVPYMTEKGTYVINGAERVVVSHVITSYSIHYTKLYDRICDPAHIIKENVLLSIEEKKRWGDTKVANWGGL